MKTKSEKFIQKRRFVMALPMLVLPFVFVIFWALGGGQQSDTNLSPVEVVGLNPDLPDAQVEEAPWDKLALYEKAVRDSLKFKEQQQTDPYAELPLATFSSEKKVFQTASPTRPHPVVGNSKTYLDPNEAKVNEKLNELYRELGNANSVKKSTTVKRSVEHQDTDHVSADVKKLEEMMEMMKSDSSEDPEMQQLGGMLDKILDIQHPDRVRNRLIDENERMREKSFEVEIPQDDGVVSLLASTEDDLADSLIAVNHVANFENSFYGLDEPNQLPDKQSNAIQAVVHDTQELVDGSTVKIRLLQDVVVNGQLIPKGFVFGTASINGERLSIKITSVHDRSSILPVSLAAYDLDGLEGIYIPGAIERDVAKQSSDQAMQGLQFMTMDQSLGAQAASAGIQAAKGLFSKKVKLVKVTVKAGYQILLKDQNDRL